MCSSPSLFHTHGIVEVGDADNDNELIKKQLLELGQSTYIHDINSVVRSSTTYQQVCHSWVSLRGNEGCPHLCMVGCGIVGGGVETSRRHTK